MVESAIKISGAPLKQGTLKTEPIGSKPKFVADKQLSFAGIPRKKWTIIYNLL